MATDASQEQPREFEVRRAEIVGQIGEVSQFHVQALVDVDGMPSAVHRPDVERADQEKCGASVNGLDWYPMFALLTGRHQVFGTSPSTNQYIEPESRGYHRGKSLGPAVCKCAVGLRRQTLTPPSTDLSDYYSSPDWKRIRLSGSTVESI